ncbi:hypothetical protein NC652_009845 [Populus alba x Populus x berolinensis]|nr:hypothetical protein NC652_009845 [Populus alba x Populus x berolinensis]KAJ7005174.1 hypothetical protein NC653_009862 [Populus alba x Populus x berolinensis]
MTGLSMLQFKQYFMALRPYLFAGHTTGVWDIKNVPADSLSEWSTPIPAAYNDHLVTFSQKS